jgi:hypothetical protein
MDQAVSGEVKIKIFNMLGEQVYAASEILNNDKIIAWNAANSQVAEGLYWYKLYAEGELMDAGRIMYTRH